MSHSSPKIKTRIEPLEEQGNIVTGMYELMEQFNVPALPEDLALFQTLRPAVLECRTSIDKAVSERDANVDKLAGLIDKDIDLMEKELRDVKQEIQDPQMLDINTGQFLSSKILINYYQIQEEAPYRRISLYHFLVRMRSHYSF